MLVNSSSQEICKYFMFAAIFYWDYPPLHQSSAELVLCGLLRQKDFLKYIFFHFSSTMGHFGEKSQRGTLCLVWFCYKNIFPRNGKFTFCTFSWPFCQFLTFWSRFNPSKNLLWLDLRWFAGLKCISNERIYQYHEHFAKITTFAPFIPPPIDFGSQSGIGLICVCRKLSNSKG